MSGLSLLDIAIAMIFFFLLLSLVCSAANEIFAAVLQTRAQFLKRGIYRLLVTREFGNAFYGHPLIDSLSDEIDWLLRKVHQKLPSYIPSHTFALVILDLTAQDPSQVPARLQAALQALLNDVAREPAQIRQSIEQWYNDAMDRVSGAYKRRVQYVLFALGMIAAILMNADSVAVIERLSTDKTLATTVADAAQQYMQRTGAPAAPSANPSPADVTDAQKRLHDTVATLDKLEVPIGWNGSSSDDTWPPDWTGALPLLQLHLTGWLITALAISFGAPFWFDVLNRFMIVRSTVKPQEKSQTEPSKG